MAQSGEPVPLASVLAGISAAGLPGRERKSLSRQAILTALGTPEPSRGDDELALAEDLYAAVGVRGKASLQRQLLALNEPELARRVSKALAARNWRAHPDLRLLQDVEEAMARTPQASESTASDSLDAAGSSADLEGGPHGTGGQLGAKDRRWQRLGSCEERLEELYRRVARLEDVAIPDALGVWIAEKAEKKEKVNVQKEQELVKAAAPEATHPCAGPKTTSRSTGTVTSRARRASRGAQTDDVAGEPRRDAGSGPTSEDKDIGDRDIKDGHEVREEQKEIKTDAEITAEVLTKLGLAALIPDDERYRGAGVSAAAPGALANADGGSGVSNAGAAARAPDIAKVPRATAGGRTEEPRRRLVAQLSDASTAPSVGDLGCDGHAEVSAAVKITEAPAAAPVTATATDAATARLIEAALAAAAATAEAEKQAFLVRARTKKGRAAFTTRCHSIHEREAFRLAGFTGFIMRAVDDEEEFICGNCDAAIPSGRPVLSLFKPRFHERCTTCFRKHTG